MRILLLKPPLNPHLVSAPRAEPLELEYLASAVGEHDVSIFDMRIDKNLERTLGTFKPDLAGITAYTCDVNTAKEVLKEVKKFDKNIKTVVGGHHATFLPHDFAQPFIDAVFIGQADLSFKAYVSALQSGGEVEGVENIALPKGNDLIFTRQGHPLLDLDSLPLPARDTTRQYRKYYRDMWGNRTALILTSRGCPFRCTFCACWKIMKGRYLIRRPQAIVEEFKSLPDEVDFVALADDNTLYDTKRAWELSALMKERKIGKKFSMYSRVDTIVKEPDLIQSFREAGLEYLIVGFESCDDEELSRLNKRTSVRLNNEAIHILHNLGISIFAHFVIDPEFTRTDFDRVLSYVKDKNLFRLSYSVLTPLPGTDLYEKTADRLAIKNYDFFDFAHSVLPTRLERKDFYLQFARLYKETYSWRRYLHLKVKDWASRLGLRGHPVESDDRFPFYKIVLLNIFMLPLYFKVKNIYRDEPVL